MNHTFTLSGLGQSPFKMVAPTKGCPTFFCEHCGRMLKNQYFVKSSDNKVSVVGIDCVKKTGDAGLIAGVNRQQKEKRAAARLAKESAAVLVRTENERSLLGGMTRAEVMEQFDARILQLKDDIKSQVEAMYVYDIFMRSNFGHSMIDNAIRPSPYNEGSVKIMLEIVAKSLSGARVNSIAYKEAMPLAIKHVDELKAVEEKCSEAMTVLLGERKLLLDKLKAA